VALWQVRPAWVTTHPPAVLASQASSCVGQNIQEGQWQCEPLGSFIVRAQIGLYGSVREAMSVGRGHLSFSGPAHARLAM